MVSEDESKLVVIIDNNKFEIYETDSVAFVKRIKVTRNTWLYKAYFYDENKSIFYDYGTQLRFKYKQLDIETGKKKSIKCSEVPRGCGYKSTKCCNNNNPILILNNKPYIFKVEDIDIAMYELK